LAPDANVVFSCEAVVTNVSWIVGGVRLVDFAAGFRIMTQQTNRSSTLSTLSTTAKGDQNNTQISCVATNTSSDTDLEGSRILIAGKDPCCLLYWNFLSTSITLAEHIPKINMHLPDQSRRRG
jgi:hypothetical protein